MFWFQLWREFKLSIAEIISLFPKGETVFCDTNTLLIDNISLKDIEENANKLWWTIKIFHIWSEIKSRDYSQIPDFILEEAQWQNWKFKYWISDFSNKFSLKKILNSVKNTLKNNGISSRFINKDFKNLNSAQIIAEKLIEKRSDYSIVNTPDSIFIWVTIWVQDIDSYSKRDFSKSRDMKVWMLPPKLAQIMINLSSNISLEKNTIYDPFVWLWTILIESLNCWNKEVYWSDLSDEMVKTAEENIKDFIKINELKDINFDIFKLNAKFIEESSVLKSKKADFIVSEWYLWEVMTRKNISIERIEKQRKSLEKIYSQFFSGLRKLSFRWNIVLSFPFWDLNWKYYYFEEIYSILEKYCIVQDLLKKDLSIKSTKVWSLLYKRDKQLVWREIFKLKIKN